jgi:serine/threonine protein kinase
LFFCLANGTKPPADLPDTCSVAAQEFFRLCLTRDPSDRPSARDLLLHPFLAS